MTRPLLIAINIALLILNAGNLALLMCQPCARNVGLFLINARAGCWPWSPKVVAYKPGMTLCPGQTAVMRIELPNNGDHHGADGDGAAKI